MPAGQDQPYRWQNGDLLLNLQVQPRASKNEFAGVHGPYLKIRLQSPPVDGAANQHLIEFLAKTFAVTKAQVEIVSGHKSRHKRLRIHNPNTRPDFILPAAGLND